jgi:thioredoxin-like negative regulator of GroEL
MLVELTDQNYPDFIEQTELPVFIEFYTPMCGACQQLEPLLDELDKHYNHTSNIAVIAKVDVSINPRLAKKYRISSVPFCVAINKDKKIKDVELGLVDPMRYFEMADKAIYNYSWWQSLLKKFGF